MRKAEKLVSGFSILMGGSITWQAWSMEYYTSIGPGPGFFPLWLGIIFTLLGMIWFLTTVRSPVPEGGKSFLPGGKALRRILLVIISTACVGVAMEWIGFQLAMFAFTIFILVVLGKREWLVTAILASVLSFGVYHTFTRWLDVTLPVASIEFLKHLGL